jgi:hypothetical protein
LNKLPFNEELTGRAHNRGEEQKVEVVKELELSPSRGEYAEGIDRSENGLDEFGEENQVDKDLPEEAVIWKAEVVVV